MGTTNFGETNFNFIEIQIHNHKPTFPSNCCCLIDRSIDVLKNPRLTRSILLVEVCFLICFIIHTLPLREIDEILEILLFSCLGHPNIGKCIDEEIAKMRLASFILDLRLEDYANVIRRDKG